MNRESSGKRHVVVYPLSFNSHVRQLLVGFQQLADAGRIDVRFDTGGCERFGVRPRHFLDAPRLCAVAETGGCRLVFDMHDTSELFEPLLAIADSYFKRSYSPAVHGGIENVRPYGLNYPVDLGRPWPTGARLALRLEPGRHAAREAWRALKLPPLAHVDIGDLSGEPRTSAEPRAIFLTRVWDPDDRPERPDERREDRRQISLMRVACVEALKARLGDRITGGLQPSAYAIRKWPALVADKTMCERPRFLAALDRHDVCIATDGLYGSIGWKFAEYVAKSRAIVSEPLRFDVVGPMAAGTNFLPFEGPEECVEQVEALLGDRERRGAMMRANSAYFREYGLPERLVAHAIEAAFQPSISRK